MSAYVVFIQNELIDESEMINYSLAAKQARGDYNIEPIAYYGGLDMLEGPPVKSLAIIKFDNMSCARNWYNSPEYQKAKQHRLRGANYQVYLVDGV